MFCPLRGSPSVPNTGRATLYGAAAGGTPGARRAIDILRKEVDQVLGQIGCPDIDALGPANLVPADLAAGSMPPG